MLPADLLERAARLAATGERRILGITGAPGCGKSTLAEALAVALNPEAAVVPVDGFHLSNAELVRLGRRDRKGAPDTFDVGGYVAALHRLRQRDDPVVHAPAFDRSLEEALAGAIPVAREVPLVITEGNYLLLNDGGWSSVAPLLDEVWYVEVDEVVRLERLVARHVSHGRSEKEARDWATGTDERNAALVATTRHRADLVVKLPDDVPAAPPSRRGAGE